MKKFRNIVISLLVIVVLSGFVIYAGSQDKPVVKKADVTVEKAEKHSHEEGSTACKEKHAKGECEGHDPGQTHDAEKGNNPGHGHEEGSDECKKAHESGECTGH